MKSYRKAENYAKQKGVSRTLPGWGFKVTPRQRRRLQKTHTEDMRRIVGGV